VTAVFACMLEYLRGFRLRGLAMGAVNLAVLAGTRADAALLVAMLFLMMVFLAARGRTFPLRRKVDLAMAGMIPALLLLGPVLFHALARLVAQEGSFDFSGRDLIRPYLLDAIEGRPLFGYGLGASRAILDPEDSRSRLIASAAAHNEYLRLAVDAGVIGCAAVFAAIVAWIWGGTRRIASADRVVLRCALVAVLLYGVVANALVASPAVVLFAWFTAAMARARLESPSRGWRRRHRATAAAA
jgi:O-antigen ligase